MALRRLTGPQINRTETLESYLSAERLSAPRARKGEYCVKAEAIAQALGGHKVGSIWMARCPAHDDRKPSLSVDEARDGKVLVCCHTGCEQDAVIFALRARGLWERRRSRATSRGTDAAQSADHDSVALRRMETALGMWRASQPANGTLVETYLRSRGITLAVPVSIRFHPELKHPSGGIWPSMVALVTRGRDCKPIAIHRTFLAPDGSAKAAIKPAKMMLGPCGGGVVRLGEPEGVLLVGEGIETCLAAQQATGQVAWAALSTSGLRTLELPLAIREVVVLADGDDPGEAAAKSCAWRWKREGRRVRVARPPSGVDFNDLLVGRIPDLDGTSP